MPGCLLGQLRGCLNVVTSAGESACCMTGCTCSGGVAVTHCFFVALSGPTGVVWQGEMCACHVHSDALSMCRQGICEQFYHGLTSGCGLCGTMTVRVCCVIGATGLVQIWI